MGWTINNLYEPVRIYILPYELPVEGEKWELKQEEAFGRKWITLDCKGFCFVLL